MSDYSKEIREATEQEKMFNELRYMIQECIDRLNRIEASQTVRLAEDTQRAFRDGLNYALEVAERVKR